MKKKNYKHITIVNPNSAAAREREIRLRAEAVRADENERLRAEKAMRAELSLAKRAMSF